MSPSSRPSPLWVVHGITIGISALGAYVFAAWSLRAGYATGRALNVGIGLFALLVAVVLSVYLLRFKKRLVALRTSPRPPAPEDPSEHSP